MNPPPHHTWQRPDGGTLAWNEYGAPGGRPVIFHHGWPSSRCQAVMIDALARDRGLRIFSPDRPGIGASSLPKAKRRLLDWPDLIEAWITHLGMERVSLLGVSGGGPYVLATVARMGHRIERAAVVCGAVPMRDLPDHREMLPAYRMLIPLRHFPPFLFSPVFAVAQAVSSLDPVRPPMSWMLRMVPEADRRTLTANPSNQRTFTESFRQAFGQGAAGVLADADIYFQDWGLSYPEIGFPIHYWHGALDKNIPLGLARHLFDRLPAARVTIRPDEGHYSMAINSAGEMLDFLSS